LSVIDFHTITSILKQPSENPSEKPSTLISIRLRLF